MRQLQPSMIVAFTAQSTEASLAGACAGLLTASTVAMTARPVMEILLEPKRV
jgi:hypothetical protein